MVKNIGTLFRAYSVKTIPKRLHKSKEKRYAFIDFFEMMIAFLTGSHFYHFPNVSEDQKNGRFFFRGNISEQEVIILPRHGTKHEHLPHHIDFRKNFQLLAEFGVKTVISFSVVGALRADIPLGTPILPNDLFFPENRFPTGEVCSIFQTSGEKGRGHLLAGSLFHSKIQRDLADIFPDAITEKTYAHSIGPRFNTKSEIRFFQNIGADIVSQTCGPEAVLANELEMNFGMLCVPIDYANGVMESPTGVSELQNNLEKSTILFEKAIADFLAKKAEYTFENFVYRF